MKEDRRVRKTRSAIKSSFIELLNEKELEKITIQDIADRADINRGTFYLHYEDKYLLLSDMEDEFISQMTFLNHLHNIMGKDPEDTAKNFINIILKNMLQHISDNITFYQTILQLNRKSKLKEICKNILVQIMRLKVYQKNIFIVMLLVQQYLLLNFG